MDERDYKAMNDKLKSEQMENKLTAEEANVYLNLIMLEFDEPEYKQALTMAIEALQSKPKQGGLTAEHILKYKQNSLNHLLHFPVKGSNQKEGTYIHASTVLEAMHEYALQFQPPTVTDEDIEIQCLNLNNTRDQVFFTEGAKWMRNKLTPNK